MAKKNEEETEEEIPVPKPNPVKKEVEERIIVVKAEDIPKEEIRETEHEGQLIVIETTEEALTEIRNSLRKIEKSLMG